MEKRRFPRINVTIPARVTPAGHPPINVQLLDTSTSVLKLECNRVAHDIMSPEEGCWRQHGKSTELSLEMALPDGSGQVNALCEVVFSRRVSKDRFQLGLRYADLTSDDYNKLTRFIDGCVEQSSVQVVQFTD